MTKRNIIFVFCAGCVVILFTINSFQKRKLPTNLPRRLADVENLLSSNTRNHEDDGTYSCVLSKGYGGGSIALSRNGFKISSTTYNVILFDNDHKIIKRGHFFTWDNDLPLTVVEMKTSSERLPESYRNRWIKAVVYCNSKWEPNDESKIALASDPKNEVKKMQVHFAPIIWENDNVTDTKGAGYFFQDNSDFEFR